MNIKEISEVMENHRRVLIPKVPEYVITELSKIIKPVIERNGKLYYIEPVDLFNISYTWDPKIAEEALDLLEGETITTYHSCAYYGFFKPTIAEVLAQLPHWEYTLENIYAFSISTGDIEIVEDGDYHAAKTTLYGKKKKEIVFPNGSKGWELESHQ